MENKGKKKFKKGPKTKDNRPKLAQTRKKSKNTKHLQAQSSARTIAEIKDLDARILLECPAAGKKYIEKETDEIAATESSGPALTVSLFSELPLSSRTLKCLKNLNFIRLTPIQKLAIPHALAGRDVLGEAQTGSGKTLAFVIPLLENLYRAGWDRSMGLGGLVISPTRELSAQIFDVLKDVGKYHDFSASCLIGGRNIQQEVNRLTQMNIIIATPGRLLQHLDESYGFDTTNLQMLSNSRRFVDEADQLVDMGFAETTSSILSQLSSSQSRQTLLFSATLSSSVQKLALISLNSPERISTRVVGNQQSTNGITPNKLKQNYLTLALHKQMEYLFSFLRIHCQTRTILFVNSCKQVRYLHEVFKRLKPGSALFELHGRQHQQKRLDVFQMFSQKSRAATLICTDIAARGIDFPAVDWVIQLNCPSTVETYIHRVGRTARYQNSGKAVLFLLPSELKFLDRLKEKNIELTPLHVNPQKLIPIQGKVSSIIASDLEIRHLAQRTFTSYLRSVCLERDKDVFNIQKVFNLEKTEKEGNPLVEDYAHSLGLASPPNLIEVLDGIPITSDLSGLTKHKKISKLEKLKQKIKEKRQSKGLEELKEMEWIEGGSDDNDLKSNNMSKKDRRLMRLRELRKLKQHEGETTTASNDEEDEDVLKVTRVLHPKNFTGPPLKTVNLDSAAAKKKLKKEQLRIRADGTAKIKGLAALNVQTEAQHIFYDEDEKVNAAKIITPFEYAVTQMNQEIESDQSDDKKGKTTREEYLTKLEKRLEANKEADKARDKQRIHEKHLKKRERERKQRQNQTEGGIETTLALSPQTDDSTEEVEEASPKRRHIERREEKMTHSSLDALETAALNLISF